MKIPIDNLTKEQSLLTIQNLQGKKEYSVGPQAA